ncbi:MAG: hypothetical protein IJ361_01395 [Spirochaetaceae bacterium]|nr:hypothetical protein [Spirochaetaceae bacterium]
MSVDSKLTLKLNTNSILKAKKYVAERGISLSKLVEDFFENITSDSNIVENTSYSPLVKELAGIISIPDDYDYKVDYENYLKEKYE